MSRLPVDRRPSVWLDYTALEPQPLPIRDDPWDEPITVLDVAQAAVAAAIFLPLFLLGLGFFIVALTPAP